MGRESYYAFIGTNSVRGSRGIYTLRIDAETGIAKIMSTAPAYNTGCLALSQDGGILYAAAEGMTFLRQSFLFPIFLGLGEYERSHRRENYSSSLPETLLMT